MTPPTTTCHSIEIEGISDYNNIFDGARDIKISRKQPAAAMHRMPKENDWNTFCDRIDDALSPLSKYRIIIQRMTIIYIIVIIGIFVGGIIASLLIRPSSDSSDHGVAAKSFALLFAATLVLFFTLLAIQYCYGMSIAKTANTKIQEICADVSNNSQHYSHPNNLSFHSQMTNDDMGPNLSFHSHMTNIFYSRRRQPPCIQVSINNKNPQQESV